MKIENRQKFLIILTAIVLGLSVADWVIFEPLGHWWKTRSQSIVDLKKNVRHGQAMILNESGIRGNWENMRTNALPGNTSLAEQLMVKSFDTWAQQSGASLVGVTPQWKNDSTNYMTLNCRVEASGNISTLGAFLYKIEKGPMALKLDSVELSAHDTTGQQLTSGCRSAACRSFQPTQNETEPILQSRFSRAARGAEFSRGRADQQRRRHDEQRRRRAAGLFHLHHIHREPEYF